MLGEGEISLGQLYKMLHVSKRKAAWMLQNGIIPCTIRPTKTHRYIIRTADVEAYLQKKRAERRREIPVGIFNAKPRKRTVMINRQPVDTVTAAECYLALADEVKGEFRTHLEKRLQYFPDALSAEKAAEMIGYGKGMMLSHIKQKHIAAVKLCGRIVVPKAAIVDFLAGDAAFAIQNKSTWHVNTILQFVKKG